MVKYGIKSKHKSLLLKQYAVDLSTSSSYDKVSNQLSVHHNAHLSKTMIKNIVDKERTDVSNFLSTVKSKESSKNEVVVEIDGFSVNICTYNSKKDIDKENRKNIDKKEVKHTIIYSKGSLSPKHISKLYNEGEYNKYDYFQTIKTSLIEKGVSKRTTVFTIADGAKWIKNFTDYAFKNNKSYFLIDYYHLSEYLNDAVKSIGGDKRESRYDYLERWLDYIDNGDIYKVIYEIERDNLIKTALIYDNDKNYVSALYKYIKNRDGQFDYPLFKKKGVEVGSGKVEAGNKLYKNRMAGPRSWNIENAKNMINILTLSFNNQLDDYWLSKQKELKVYEHIRILEGGK